jgi:hypothetical protein
MAKLMSESNSRAELPRLSLASGGLLFQLFRKTHLWGDEPRLVFRRVLVVLCLVWLPLLVLSAFAGSALRGAVSVPFLHDFDANIRFLIALSILLAAEVGVDSSISSSLQRFVTRRIVLEEDLPAFRAATRLASRLCNSFVVDLGVIIVVYTAGHWLWLSRVALGESTWYGSLQGTHLHLTAAGYWYAFFSIPVFRFIVARWYLRLFAWFQLLWRVSRLNLQLEPAHPDRAGGLNFLGTASYAFAPILIAQGAVLAGMFADRVVLERESFLDFKVTAAFLAIFWVLALLGPLVMFTPHLLRAKRQGRSEYGSLASQYLAAFKAKWINGPAPTGDQLLGTSDIQSLADLVNTYDAVRRMRLVPFGLQEVTILAAMTLAPLLPLMLTVNSLDQLVGRALKMLF